MPSATPKKQGQQVRVYYPQARAILQVICDGFGASAADSDTLVIPVLPKTTTVHINSYRQADSWELVFDAGDLPIDPALIRAGSAEIYVFATASLKEGVTILDRKHPLSDPDPGNLRPRERTDIALMEAGAATAADVFTLGIKPRITGLFDQVDIELSESGKWVTISGQDYTAHLASIQWPPMPDGTGRRIPTGQRLDNFVSDLIAAADPTGALSVEVRGIKASDLPVIGAAETRSTTRGIPVEQNTTYWDVIYKVCERYGYICFVSGLSVVISTPKILLDSEAAKIRRVTWGRNLSHLSLKRHLGKEQVPTIICQVYDPKSKKTITVQYPDGTTIDRSVIFDTKLTRKGNAKVHANVKQSTHISKTGKVKTTLRERDEYKFIDPPHGITDKKILAQICENTYHLLGKAERSVIAKTKDLTLPIGDGTQEVNVLDIEAGDALFIEWDEFNRELLKNPALSDQEKVNYLVGRGFNIEVASTIAQHYEVLEGLDRPLRFKEGSITFDNEQGIEIEMELQDFIVIDGKRPDDGSTRQGRAAKNHAALTNSSGQPIGGKSAAIHGGR